MRTYLLAGVAALLMGLFVLPTTAVAKQEKVGVCHFDKGTGVLAPISVPQNTAEKHLAKHAGDALVGVDVNEDCEPLGPVCVAPPPTGRLVVLAIPADTYDGLSAADLETFSTIDPNVRMGPPARYVDGEGCHWTLFSDLRLDPGTRDAVEAFLGPPVVGSDLIPAGWVPES